VNFLIITADDMRADELRYMPNLRRFLLAQGTNFTAARCNVPLCSPTRAGIVTGQLSRYHAITTNADNPTTTQYNNSTFKALDNAGYRVGLVGKFITALAGVAVKPGFDFWRAIVGDGGSGYGIYEPLTYEIYDGTSTTQPGIYQDHYLAGQAIDFIRGSEPWCLWYCPTSPHWPWDSSPPNHQNEWASSDFPITFETDVSDKPAYIQALTAPDAAAQAGLVAEERFRLRELLALDDTVGALMATIQATGNASDTTVLFVSDNGNMLGEHRIYSTTPGARASLKNVLYEPSLRVPMVAVGPDFTRQTCTVPVNHQDMVATMHTLAGSTPLAANQAGTALHTIAATPGSYSTRQLLHYRNTAGDAQGYPTADAITTATRKLIRYQGQTGTDQYEMYDLDTDPNELTNVANGGGRLTERNTLETALNALLA
jgi:N-acetylglucosamine-6-sulfatase